MKTTFQRFSRILACAGLILFFSAIAAQSGTVAFNYDLAGRLTTADYAAGKSINYTYDPAGNLLQRVINLVANPDSDNDGMDDAWEQLHFQTLSRDGTGDFDNDRFSDLNEFLAGTLPKDAASALKVLPNPAVGTGSVTVQWLAVSGKTYRLQFKNSLSDARWSDIAGDVTASGATATKVDSAATNPSGRFYRVLLVQ